MLLQKKNSFKKINKISFFVQKNAVQSSKCNVQSIGFFEESPVNCSCFRSLSRSPLTARDHNVSHYADDGLC